MRSGAWAARVTLAVVLGPWAGITDAGETLWDGEVRVVDAKTLAGWPDGPILPLGGIEPPPPDARCPPVPEGPGCGGLAVQALRDATAGQSLLCEQDGDGVVCRADGMDVAEWMVRLGWAVATGEKLREAEEEARLAGEGMWWYGRERFGQMHDAPPARYAPLPMPGEDAVRACAKGRDSTFARREYGNLMAIESVEWLIEETRLRWENRHAVGGDGSETALDAKIRETLDAARQLCGVLGSASAGSGGAGGVSGDAIETVEGEVDRLADRTRETCREAAAGAVRAGRIEDLAGVRQIARHATLRTGRLGERLWEARERGDEEEARRILGRAHAVFENAMRQCDDLAGE